MGWSLPAAWLHEIGSEHKMRLVLERTGAGLRRPDSGVPQIQQNKSMYGLIGKIIAIAGERDALIAVLLEGASSMPGCLSYIVAEDADDANAIWVTEVWSSRALHASSLELPSVQQAISRGRPLIEGFGERFETEPAGGHGLQASSVE